MLQASFISGIWPISECFQVIQSLPIEFFGCVDSCKRPRGACRGRLATVSASLLAYWVCRRQMSPRLSPTIEEHWINCFETISVYLLDSSQPGEPEVLNFVILYVPSRAETVSVIVAWYDLTVAKILYSKYSICLLNTTLRYPRYHYPFHCPCLGTIRGMLFPLPRIWWFQLLCLINSKNQVFPVLKTALNYTPSLQPLCPCTYTRLTQGTYLSGPSCETCLAIINQWFESYVFQEHWFKP